MASRSFGKYHQDFSKKITLSQPKPMMFLVLPMNVKRLSKTQNELYRKFNVHFSPPKVIFSHKTPQKNLIFWSFMISQGWRVECDF